MQKTLTVIIGLFFTLNTSISFGQKDSILFFETSYTSDNLTNLNGGIKNGYTYLGMAEISIGFSTKNASLWNGGEFIIHGINTHGGQPTEEFIGDYQTASNIEAGDHSFLSEFYFQQEIHKFNLIIGLQDLNAEFAYSEYSSLFINSSFGITPVIGGNIPTPIFPITGLGLTISYKLTNSITIQTALYDGNFYDFEDNKYNINWELSKNDGYSNFTEIKCNRSIIKGKITEYKIGYFFNKRKEIYEDNSSETISTNGLYWLLDQEIIKHNESSLGIFIQGGYTPKKDDNNYFHIGGGLLYKNLFSNDQIGIAFTQANFYDSGNETALELTYQININDNIALQPDMQYILKPSGKFSGIDNTLIGLIRVSLGF